MAESFLAQTLFKASRTTNNTANKHVPMLNDLNKSLSSYLSSYGQTRRKKSLMNWYKSIPELTGIVNKVAEDIVHKYHFEPINPDDSGRNKIMKANRFATEVGLDDTMLSQAIDLILCGEAFGWMGKLSKEVVSKVVSAVMKSHGLSVHERIEMKSLLMEEKLDGFTNINGIDEDLLLPRKYRYVASSSMETAFNDYDITGYVQRVGVNDKTFSVDEIIRFTQMSVDGRVAGFTPVESVVVQLELLRQMWQNNLSMHLNGGHPDKMFILKNERVGTPSYNLVKQALEKYRLVENKHGHLLFAGDVDVKELQQLDDMFFSNVGLYVTGVLMLQWQLARSSVPFIIGGTNTKDDTGGNSEKGYWRKIQNMQRRFAERMNTQLWIPYFGVKLVFDNTFVHEDVQLATTEQLRLNNLKLKDEILAKAGKQLSDAQRLRELGYTLEQIEDLKTEYQPIAHGMNNQLPVAQTMEGSSNLARRKAKQEEQANSTKRQGMSPQGN